MKRILALFLAAVLICSMTACQDQSEPDPTFPPGSNGPSKPLTEKEICTDHDLAEAPQTVDDPVTGPYGVNLSQGHARCAKCQADLTAEHVGLSGKFWSIKTNHVRKSGAALHRVASLFLLSWEEIYDIFKKVVTE